MSAVPTVAIVVAGPDHLAYAEEICTVIEEAAKARRTGIAKRDPAYVRKKMEDRRAVIALAQMEGHDRPVFAGFCYIEAWTHGKYVANSGLIVHPRFRKLGLARRIKRAIFNLSRERFPDAKIFGITTSLAVMKINADLGYRPVTFSELTQDEVFWKGCKSCPNFDILTRTQRSMCLCTGMLFDPNDLDILDPDEDGETG
ncbi:MAG: GNAT family N-acetyltransferase [Bacteroidota bacterium]